MSDVFAHGLFPLCPATHDQGLRWLFDLSTVLLLLDCQPGDRVLDLGAGSGFSSEMLARFGYDVVAADPDLTALAHNRRRPSFDRARIAGSVRVAAGVAEQLPFQTESFDGIVGMNVMHHVADLAESTRELARVLKPGARAVFCEPGLDHLQAPETRRARTEYGEDDRAFDVIAFLRAARELGFAEAMLSATLQSPLRLLPIQELEIYLSGRHPRPHMTPAGVIDELHRRHAYVMLQRAGVKPRTSRHPGTLAAEIRTGPVPAIVAPGDRVSIQVEARNTGDTRWLARAHPLGGYVTAGCKWLDADTGRLIADDLGRTTLAVDVAPGELSSATIAFVVPPALPPGSYVLKVDLVNELVCWFSDVPPNHASEHRVRVTR